MLRHRIDKGLVSTTTTLAINALLLGGRVGQIRKVLFYPGIVLGSFHLERTGVELLGRIKPRNNGINTEGRAKSDRGISGYTGRHSLRGCGGACDGAAKCLASDLPTLPLRDRAVK